MAVTSKLISVTDGWGISRKIALRWMPLDLTDDKSTLVKVMAWCRQATNHYLCQCWPRSLSPYGVTRPQWVNLPGGCWISASTKFPDPYYTHEHAHVVTIGKWPWGCTSKGQDGSSESDLKWISLTVSAKFKECLLCPWTCPCGPEGQMTMTLHICRPIRFQWT